MNIRNLPFALTRMVLDRMTLTSNVEIHFSKSFGCGKGKTFTPLDADFRRWGLLICLEEENLQRFDESKIVMNWRSHSLHEFRAVLTPITSRGKWSKKEPFESQGLPLIEDVKIAVITRARVNFMRYPRFLLAIPRVTSEIRAAPGLISAIGIGEAPIGFQGTFSLWETESLMRDFAYKSAGHSQAIAGTSKFNWYREELFARFAVKEIRGAL